MGTMHLPSRMVGAVAAFLAVSLTTAFIIIGRASTAHTLLPSDIALLRIIGAALIAAPWGLWLTRRAGAAHAQRSLGGLSPVPLGQTLATGLAGSTLFCLLAYSGFFFAPAVHASILLPGSQPLWIALLAVPLLGERLRPGNLLGLLLIVLGIAAIGTQSLLSATADAQAWRGDLLFAGGGLCWATYVVLARRWQLDPIHSTIAITVCALFTYAVPFACLVLAGLVPSHLSQASSTEILFQMSFQGVGVGIVTGIAFITMAQAFGPVRAGMLISLVPGLSALGATVFLGEPLTLFSVAGLAFVTAGILMGVRSQGRPARGMLAPPRNHQSP